MISALSQTQTQTFNVRSTQAQRPSAAEVFKQLDSDNKGYLTESDVVNISSAGKKAADAAQAADLFKKMDADGDGKVTESEFTVAAESHAKTEAGGSKGAARPAGPPPAGGGGGGGQSAAAVASSSSTEEADPADANQDGTVSQEEQRAYDAKRQQAQGLQSGTSANTFASTNASTNAGTNAEAARAVKAYQEISLAPQTQLD